MLCYLPCVQKRSKHLSCYLVLYKGNRYSRCVVYTLTVFEKFSNMFSYFCTDNFFTTLRTYSCWNILNNYPSVLNPEAFLDIPLLKWCVTDFAFSIVIHFYHPPRHYRAYTGIKSNLPVLLILQMTPISLPSMAWPTIS